MKRKFSALIMVIFTAAAIGLILIQVYQTRRTIAATDSLFTISVTNTMENVMPQLDQLTVTDLNYSHIDSIISEELLINGINTEPEVAIASANMGEFFYCSHPGTESSFRQSPYKFSFHPTEIQIDAELFIILVFPHSPLIFQHDANFFTLISMLLIFVVGVLLAIAVHSVSKMRKVDEMKSDFINNMTHEIKTPLATISLASQMLRDPSVSTDHDQQDTFLNIISDETARLRVLVDTILQSAKMSNKKYTISLGEVDMHDMVQKGIQSFVLTLKNRGGHIATDLKANPCVIYADPLHMSNLIHNLIDNAIKYSTESPDISISTHAQDQQFVLRIQDHGIGISKEDQRHIFEKFYRVSTGNVHNVKGFGIGLNYVAQVVQLHHGTIEVESELGQGTTFTVRLPI